MFDEPKDVNFDIIRKIAAGLSIEKLVVLELSAALLKSTSLALLMLRDVLSVSQAFEKSRLEESFQIELFGQIEESHTFDELMIYNQLLALKVFWDLNK